MADTDRNLRVKSDPRPIETRLCPGSELPRCKDSVNISNQVIHGPPCSIAERSTRCICMTTNNENSFP
ncbi:hypothetical protein SLA2020_447880 [Shorea laevis]